MRQNMEVQHLFASKYDKGFFCPDNLRLVCSESFWFPGASPSIDSNDEDRLDELLFCLLTNDRVHVGLVYFS